jgi:hypothetical protein
MYHFSSRRNINFSCFSIILVLLIVLLTSVIANAATFTVSNTNDDDGAGSLRYWINQANLSTDEDTIIFDPQVFNAPKTITLTSGQISITNSLTINGTGANLLTISGNNQSRIFFSNFSSSTLSINNLTLTQGFALNGGAIYTSSSLKLSNVVITGNMAMGAEENRSVNSIVSLGGGIYSSGELIITDSIISNNTASGVVVQAFQGSNFGDQGTSAGGGGIYAGSFSPVIVNCIFTNNTAKGVDSPDATGNKAGGQGGYGLGGAIYGLFSLKIYNSTFTNNSAVGGNGGSVNSNTIEAAGSGGTAYGGAVISSRSIILNSTFYNNKTVSGNGGGNAYSLSNGGDGGKSSGGAIRDLDLKIANTTIVDNKVIAGNGRIGGDGFGGGVFFVGDDYQWSIVSSTITGNSATAGTGTQSNGLSQGGGVYIGTSTTQGRYFDNNIVAENTALSGADVFGNLINPYNNLVRVGEGVNGLTNGVNGNLVGTKDSPVNPMLAPLADNGGLTQTRALLSGSPAINAGNNSRAVNPLTSQNLQFDQRGFQRIVPSGGVIDIGAFESGSSIVPISANPDLRDSSDTGLSQSDNITKATAPLFEVTNVIPGAKIELLRNNVVVASTTASSLFLPSFSVFLTDSSPPLDAIVQYSARQTIGGVTSANSPSLNVTFDNTSPTVTINQAASQSDPATNLPIFFTVVFNETVSDFDQHDISLTGSTADISAASIFVNRTSSSTFTVEIFNLRSPGRVVVSIPAGAAYDPVINYSNSSTSTDNSVNYQPNIVGVNVSGRIRRNSGLIKTASVITLTDNLTGEIWTARTNPSGFYHFLGLKVYEQIGSRFSVRISNKGFVYTAPQILTINGNRTNLNYTVP